VFSHVPVLTFAWTSRMVQGDARKARHLIPPRRDEGAPITEAGRRVQHYVQMVDEDLLRG
jgi:hypothetical protein